MKDKNSLTQRSSNLSKKNLCFQCIMYIAFLIAALIYASRNEAFLMTGAKRLWWLFEGNVSLTLVLVIGVIFAMVLSVSAGGYPYNDFKPVLIFYGLSFSVVCQVFTLLVLQAWTWDFFTVAGTFFLTQYITGYMTGGIQKDVAEDRISDNAFCIIAELWILLPMTGFCWGVSWVYYTALFNS